MERLRPKLQKKKLRSFNGEELIAEYPSIQEGARFFKKETISKQFNWAANNKGIWYGEAYSKNGATYFLQPIKKMDTI